MDIVIALDGGRGDELYALEDVLLEDSSFDGAGISLCVGQGQHAGEVVLDFVGEITCLQGLLETVHAHVARRRQTSAGADLRATVIRNDLPNGIRGVRLAADGPASEAIETARTALE